MDSCLISDDLYWSRRKEGWEDESCSQQQTADWNRTIQHILLGFLSNTFLLHLNMTTKHPEEEEFRMHKMKMILGSHRKMEACFHRRFNVAWLFHVGSCMLPVVESHCPDKQQIKWDKLNTRCGWGGHGWTNRLEHTHSVSRVRLRVFNIHGGEDIFTASLSVCAHTCTRELICFLLSHFGFSLNMKWWSN